MKRTLALVLALCMICSMMVYSSADNTLLDPEKGSTEEILDTEILEEELPEEADLLDFPGEPEELISEEPELPEEPDFLPEEILLEELTEVEKLEANETSGTCGPNLRWSFDKATGVLTINGSGEMTSEPWLNSFTHNIMEISFPNGITSICYRAFKDCNMLKSVSIPDSVKTIGFEAFSNCSSLNSLNLGKGLQTLKYGAFQNCTSLQSVTIPSTLRSADTGYSNGPFQGCTGLTNVQISEGASALGYAMFKGCTRLSEITIPGTIKTIPESSFDGCTALKTVTLEN